MDNEFEEQGIGEEEQSAFIEWWNTYIPKEYITILNTKEYAVAVRAIKKIVSVLQNCCDEDELPQFEVVYDKAFGTKLALKVVVSEYGMTVAGNKIKAMASVLPDNCNVLCMPKTNGTTLIEFTFHNVKELIAHEEKPDIPPID